MFVSYPSNLGGYHCALKSKRLIMLSLASVLSLSCTSSFAADLEPIAEEEAAPKNFEERFVAAIKDSKTLLNTRLRYENADQSVFANDANGVTFRARFGFETADFEGFKLLAEGDFTQSVGVDNFNSTVNGNTTFPIIADPNSQRLNRLHLTYKGIIPGTKFIGGRQRIKLDNDRFVGNVGFRQNEQTFDAIRVQNTLIENLTLDYTFAWQANRIFGSDAPDGGAGNAGTAEGNSHFANVSYALPFGKITGYGYFVDADDFAPAQSNQTFGGRFVGNHKFERGFNIGLEAEFANQTEFQANQNNISLNYYTVIGSIGYKRFTLKGGIETLEGDGTAGFATPFATLHKFNGDADVFLVTPTGGLQDLNVSLQYKVAKVPVLGDVRLLARYHDFNSELTGADIGKEFDFGIYTKPTKHTSVSFEYADYQTDSAGSGIPSGTDLRRLFLTLGFKL